MVIAISENVLQEAACLPSWQAEGSITHDQNDQGAVTPDLWHQFDLLPQ
jgi:hypothetical protein